MVLSQAGRYAQAEPIERAALAGYRTLYAADSQQVLDAEGNLAFILDNQYKYQEALRWMRAVVAAMAPRAGVDDPGYGLALINVGELEETWGDYPAALGQARKSVGSGKSVSVRGDLGARRLLKNKTNEKTK